ncbi:MAG TPA: C1 family peptidase [Kineosporiaceae bacterium]|jgi:C1A family cysteine protease|nr:C1 family peptidase [Kineosporiaceae bacterium]
MPDDETTPAGGGTPAPLDLAELRSALAENDHPWRMTQTSISRLTEDQRRLRLGVPLTDEALAGAAAVDVLAAQARAQAAGAPAAFDVRSVDGVDYDGDGVRNQGGCGSCVAFGTVGAAEIVYRFTRRVPHGVDLSEAHLFYVHGRSHGVTCETGWMPGPAYADFSAKGVTLEDYYPYTAGDQDGTSRLNADWPNRVAKVTGSVDLTGDPARIKQHISTYGAATACFVVFQDFFSYGSGVYRHVTGEAAGGHCVVLIGYDDAAGCWIARNSWGAGWGDQGWFRIGYGECSIETWQVIGPTGVSLRAWLPDQRVLGLWSNEADGNLWAYAENRGWLKLDGGAVPTNVAMAGELAASKALGRPVGLFEDNGSVQQIYAW